MRGGFGGITLLFTAIAWGGPDVDPKLAHYKPVQQNLQGTLKCGGSDAMNNQMTLWAEGFRKLYPNVPIEIGGKGGRAGPWFPEGTRLVPMSRPMKPKEIAEFEKIHGYKPTAFRTSLDLVAVFVHKDNPIRYLTLQEVDAIFSKTRRGGRPKDIATWGDLGLAGDWKDKPIVLHGRNSASDTYGYFKEHALFGGDYKDAVRQHPGSSAVVSAVAADRCGIGYCGIGYATAEVRALPLSPDGNSKPVPATPENGCAGKYPLARYLYLHADIKPGVPLDPLRREFLRYVFSKEGQTDVVKDGYFPVSAALAREELAKLGKG